MKRACVVLIAAVAWGMGWPAGAVWAQVPDGEIVAEYADVVADFSGGDAAAGQPEFTVIYDVQVLALPDGRFVSVFDQRGSDDVLTGEVDSTGVPPLLENPGKEEMSGGVMQSDAQFFYDYYRYVDQQGRTATWSSVVFTFPPGALPFPAPELTGATEAESSPAAVEEAPLAGDAPREGGGFPIVVVVIVLLLLLLLAGLVLAVGNDEDEENEEDEEGWIAWFKRKLKGLLKVGSRSAKGRAGPTIDAGTIGDTVDVVLDNAPALEEKRKWVEQKKAYNDAMGIETPDTRDTGMPVINAIAGTFVDERYSAGSRDEREKASGAAARAKARRDAYERGRHSQYHDMHPEDDCNTRCNPPYDDATPEQIEAVLDG
jgi:hypothetical protein